MEVTLTQIDSVYFSNYLSRKEECDLFLKDLKEHPLVESDHFIHRGVKCIIRRTDANMRTYCVYVDSKFDPQEGMHVHGGITFKGEIDGIGVNGWDFAHTSDFLPIGCPGQRVWEYADVKMLMTNSIDACYYGQL
jgi:hypothetical protein